MLKTKLHTIMSYWMMMFQKMPDELKNIFYIAENSRDDRGFVNEDWILNFISELDKKYRPGVDTDLIIDFYADVGSSIGEELIKLADINEKSDEERLILATDALITFYNIFLKNYELKSLENKSKNDEGETLEYVEYQKRLQD